MRLERIIGMIVFILWTLCLVISSWLSVESILLSWECLSPFKWLLYLLTIPIYLTAAICLNCVIVSVDRFISGENGTRKFTLGLLGWIALWLALWLGFIIPTQTHALVYKQIESITIQESTLLKDNNDMHILNNNEQQVNRMKNVCYFWENLLKGHFEITGNVMWLRVLLFIVIDISWFVLFIYPTIQTIRINNTNY